MVITSVAANCFFILMKGKFNWLLNLLCSGLKHVQNFGEPFFLVIHERETLADVKTRIQKKLQVPDEEFSKVLFNSSYIYSSMAMGISSVTFFTCYLKPFFNVLYFFYYILFDVQLLVISGSLHFCPWVGLSIYRTVILWLTVFR